MPTRIRICDFLMDLRRQQAGRPAAETAGTAILLSAETNALLELIAKDPQAFILKQGWADVLIDAVQWLKELRSPWKAAV